MGDVDRYHRHLCGDGEHERPLLERQQVAGTAPRALTEHERTYSTLHDLSRLLVGPERRLSLLTIDVYVARRPERASHDRDLSKLLLRHEPERSRDDCGKRQDVEE